MLNPSPNKPQLKDETEEMMLRLFPFKQEEGLKVYAILSTTANVAPLLSENAARMVITAAYSLDEALRINHVTLEQTLSPGAIFSWREGVMFLGMAYELLVPREKIAQMVKKIKAESLPNPTEKKEAVVSEFENHARYIFEMAGATPYEKGILTGIINRFRTKINGK